MWYTYALYSKQEDRFYIGFSEDVDKRFLEHQRGNVWTTSRMSDPILVYYEACLDKKDAQERERSLKTGFGRQYLRKRVENYLRAHSSVG
jgi:putative endonuclease